MKRVSLALGVIVVGCLLLTVITVGVSRLNSPDPRGNWLTYSSCQLPCWRGLEPGVSTYTNLQQVTNRWPDLRQVPLGTLDYLIYSGLRIDLGQGRTIEAVFPVALNARLIPIRNFNFQLPPTALTLSEALQQLGAPTRYQILGRVSDRLDLIPSTTGLTLSFNFEERGSLIFVNVSVNQLGLQCPDRVGDLSVSSVVLRPVRDSHDWPGTLWSAFSDFQQELCQNAGYTPSDSR